MTDTEYFAIAVDANNIKLARSKTAAQAGTAITYVSASGGGTHSIEGYSPNACSIQNCVFDNCRGQNVGYLNGRNVSIHNNTFVNPQLDPNAALIALIDIEPNSEGEVVENLSITANLLDCRAAQQNLNSLIIQSGANLAGCVGGLIADNIIIGSAISGKLISGLQLAGLNGFTIADNYVRNSVQYGLSIYGSRKCVIENNVFESCGSGGVNALGIINTSESLFDNNKLTAGSPTVAQPDSRKGVETEVTWTVNTNGTSVHKTAGTGFLKFWDGLTVNINNVDYVIGSIIDFDDLVLTGSAGVQTGVTMLSVFSSNEYKDNRIEQGLTLSSTGSSKIKSDWSRVVRDSIAPPQITSNQNDYLPSNPYAYRFDLSTDATRNITGFGSNAYPLYYVPINGEKHLLYNAGSNQIQIKHEDTNSTAANRFKNANGSDFTIFPGQAAEIEYIGSISRWAVFKKGVV